MRWEGIHQGPSCTRDDGERAAHAPAGVGDMVFGSMPDSLGGHPTAQLKWDKRYRRSTALPPTRAADLRRRC